MLRSESNADSGVAGPFNSWVWAGISQFQRLVRSEGGEHASIFNAFRLARKAQVLYRGQWCISSPTDWKTGLNDRDTTLVLVSRAPLAKLDAYKAQRGWSIPWFSSFGSDFNYDFHVTLDANVAPVEYNYRPKAEMLARKTPMARRVRSMALASSLPSTARSSTPIRSMRAAPGA
jgi:Bacterial protein of unknown function (DUF899)